MPRPSKDGRCIERHWGVASNHGGITPYHPMPWGLPLAKGYPLTYAYATLGGWDPTQGGWHLTPYCYS